MRPVCPYANTEIDNAPSKRVTVHPRCQHNLWDASATRRQLPFALDNHVDSTAHPSASW